ncbi:MAG: ATP-binding cassette domain-containing protein [Myxococcales bacterium]|nr:ATP-binding cassette domain-containing protein [Myxococcales bacterium]
MTRLAPLGLVLAVAAVDVVARLAVPASLLALAGGHALSATIAAAVVSVLSLLRSLLAGRLVEHAVAAGWSALAEATRGHPVAALSARAPTEGPHPLLDATFRTVQVVANVVPRLLADVVGLLVATVAVVVFLDPAWLLLGVVVAPLVGGVMWASRRAFRREEAMTFDNYAELGQGLDLLLGAPAELRAQGCESRVADEVVARARALAGAQRRAAAYSALLGLLPVGLMLLAATASVWSGHLSAATERFAEVGVIGATTVALLVSVVQSLEQWSRSAPQREALLHFLAAARPEVAPADGAGSWRAPLRVEDLTVCYEGAAAATPDGVTFDWPEGVGLVVMGPNGAGKSTLALALLGLVPLTRGCVELDGRTLDGARAAALRRRVVFVPQAPYVAPDRSVGWHLDVMVPRAAAGSLCDHPEVEPVLDRLGLLEVLRRHRGHAPLDVPMGELSGGERRRLHLARAFLAEEAELVVLDEPEAALDGPSRKRLAALLGELATTHRVLLIAHDAAVVPDGFMPLTLPGTDAPPGSDAGTRPS